MTTTENSRPVRTRIAPSPTGDPHVGTAYIGLLNYLFARQRGGKFLLRIEDTDRARFVESSEQMIFDALRWIGLQWDEGPDVGGPHGPYRQSERTEIYRKYAQVLLDNGSAYRSFATAEELEAEREKQKAAKLPPRYVRAAHHVTPELEKQYLAENRPFVIRMAVPPEGSTTFRDELRGEITFDHANVDDQVLLKSDGFPTYHLANVVDDHLMEITDVIRAEEWISSTPKHVLLYKAFGWELPRFWHMPLLRNADKSKISKRKNPVSLVYYQQAGYLPQAMLNFLGLMGGGMAAATEQEIVSQGLNTKEADIFSLSEMLEKFDFKRISLGGPVFDQVKLKWLNGEYIRKLSPADFYAALRSTIFSDEYLQAIAALMQPRVNTLSEFGDMTGFFFRDDVLPPQDLFLPKKRTLDETLVFAADQLAALEGSTWNTEAIDAALRELGTAKDWSVKENFMLLRAILTGSAQSPPLLESLV
ncbi:MAG TPA: glutamate--tRNA ligase, partial [Acidobacteriaceae bacterium]|nr:glutamate--tRNA ligase [Acidobacteriaceae bacterium]